MIEKGLAVLQYSPNNCYVQIVPISEAREVGFIVDEKRRTWSSDLWKDVPFNTSRGRHLNRTEYLEGVIGVYDCCEIQNLNAMVHAATEAVRERGRSDGD